MTVTIGDIVRIGPTTHELRFSSSLPDPTFYLFRNDILVDTTKCNCARIQVQPRDLIDVLDVAGELPTPAVAGIVELSWSSVAAAKSYRIELEGPPATWTTVGKVNDAGTRATFTTAELPPSVNNVFRVIAIGADNNESAPVSVTLNISRHPAAPDVTAIMNAASKKVTFALAA